MIAKEIQGNLFTFYGLSHWGRYNPFHFLVHTWEEQVLVLSGEWNEACKDWQMVFPQWWFSFRFARRLLVFWASLFLVTSVLISVGTHMASVQASLWFVHDFFVVFNHERKNSWYCTEPNQVYVGNYLPVYRWFSY